MPLPLTSSASPALPPWLAAPSRARVRVAASADAAATSAGERRRGGGGFPSFLPPAVESIRDGDAIRLAKRIERVPVQTGFSKAPILSSCVRPLEQQQDSDPVVLLHGFDSSCLEWRYTYPLLEEAGLEAWAVDILGWGFSDLEARPPCDVASKREHLYQFWKSYVKRPMVLVGPSLGAAVAIDFSINYPEAVSKLIFIDASVYTEGPKDMTRMPRFVPYAGCYIYYFSGNYYYFELLMVMLWPSIFHADLSTLTRLLTDPVICAFVGPQKYSDYFSVLQVSILKSLPLRLLATRMAFYKIPGGRYFDWVQIGRLHCLLPWWEDATVDFMVRGGYNVLRQIKQVKHKCLIVWGEDDGIISSKLAYRLHQELSDASLRMVGQCGHIPHVEKPREAAEYILEFLKRDKAKKVDRASLVTSALVNR